MKLRIFSAIAMVFAMLAALMPGGASAAAVDATWQVSITYQNLGSAPATVSVNFYPEANSTPVTFNASSTLAPMAGTSLSVGTVIATSFKGSAVMSADQPLSAVIVQFATGVPNRPLSNGFSLDKASTTQYVATVLKGSSNSNTIFSVQNTESTATSFDVEFYAAGSSTATHTMSVSDLPAGSAQYFDVASIAELPAGFNGSAIVTNATGAVVVSVNELSVVNNAAKGFEGLSDGAATVYMPSALCKYGPAQQNSFYALQAVGGNVDYEVVYTSSTGTSSTKTGSIPAANGKASVDACGTGGMADGSTGSAVINVTGGTGTLLAIGKIAAPTSGLATAFVGFDQGATDISMPYIRWANPTRWNAGKGERSFIAIQNIADVDAANVTVDYVDRDGNVVATADLGTIAAKDKANSDPFGANALNACGGFGEYGADCSTPTGFGGAAVVHADSGSLAVIVRVVGRQAGSPWGEDYNGIDF